MMNASTWTALFENTVFLPPSLVEGFCREFPDGMVMPLTFRGTKAEYSVPHNNGYPVKDNPIGEWYSVWEMRPSRDVCSIALGLKRRELQRNRNRTIECEDGSRISASWTPHHVHECGISPLSIKERAERFTNLANLVLVAETHHNHFIHGDNLGAQWLRYMIAKLYPSRALPFGAPPAKPPGSLERCRIAKVIGDPLRRLKELRNNEPAGNDIATRRLIAARADGDARLARRDAMVRRPKSQASDHKHKAPLPSGLITPRDAATSLRSMGYIARQNHGDASLYLNLGGNQSQVDKEGFQGLVLLNPTRNLVFGACAPEIVEFRGLVMHRTPVGEWKRSPGVPGPKADERVEVTFVYSDEAEPRICCETDKGRIWIDDWRTSLIAIQGKVTGGATSWRF
jgi:hypothetical protein